MSKALYTSHYAASTGAVAATPPPPEYRWEVNVCVALNSVLPRQHIGPPYETQWHDRYGDTGAGGRACQIIIVLATL